MLRHGGHVPANAHFAGGREQFRQVKRQIRHVYLAPLRDAQRELDSANGRRLAFIIEQLTDPRDREAFLAAANENLGTLAHHGVITKTADAIQGYVTALTEPVRGQHVRLGFEDYELRRLARSLRLKMAEQGIEAADLAESGLGYANLLFIATVVLELRYARDAELTLFLVEEPEAHLHPQLQAVLLEFLREQAEASAAGDDSHGPMGRIQVIATTHSPNLASSVGIENVVVLRTKQEPEEAAPADGRQPVARSMTVALPLAGLELSRNARRKIDQYLDATRAAVLFARNIILVEGISEAVLLPVLARRCVFPADRAKQRAFHAATIITVGSVDFEPYIRLLLGPIGGLTVVDHLVVITDSDPPAEAGNGGRSRSPNRPAALQQLATELGASAQLTVAAAKYTLEADLLGEATNSTVLERAYLAQHPYNPSQDKWQTIANSNDPAKALYETLREDRKFISKGEFAHDIALAVGDGQPFVVPPYLRDAIEGVVAGAGASDAV